MGIEPVSTLACGRAGIGFRWWPRGQSYVRQSRAKKKSTEKRQIMAEFEEEKRFPSRIFTTELTVVGSVGGHPGSVPHSRPLVRDSHLGKLTTETATKKGAQPQCGGKSMAILCELDSNRVGWLVGSIAVITAAAAEANGER